MKNVSDQALDPCLTHLDESDADRSVFVSSGGPMLAVEPESVLTLDTTGSGGMDKDVHT